MDPSSRLLQGTLVILILKHLFGLQGSKHEHCASVFVSPLLKHHLPNLRSLFQRDVRAHASPSPLDFL